MWLPELRFRAGNSARAPASWPAGAHGAQTGRYLLGVELVELGLGAVSAPQAQHLGLGAVGHVDELLVPPALVHRPDVTAQHHAVVTYLRAVGGLVSWVSPAPGLTEVRPAPGTDARWVLRASPRSGFSPDTQPSLGRDADPERLDMPSTGRAAGKRSH